jgi:predicted acylesterase/phospholipase RssA
MNRDDGLIAKAQEFDGERSSKLLKSIEMKKKPSFIEISSISQPTKADFNYIVSKRIKAALDGAMCVSSHEDVVEFRKYIGLGAVIGALLGKVPEGSNIDRIDAVKALCRLIRYEQVSLSSSSLSRPIVIEVSSQPAIINVLCDIMEKPFKRFPKIHSQADRDRDLRFQTEAVALVQRLVRSHPDSSKLIGRNTRIRGILNDIIQDDPYSVDASSFTTSAATIAPFNISNVEDTSILKRSTGIYTKYYKIKKTVPASNNITEYLNLRTSQMAKVAHWSLGGVKWTPRQPGQTGIRILSLDGGGTRGVLSIAYLKEIMARINMNSTVKLEPYQVFDVICGTSTGGIIAVLLGVKRVSVDDAERLYDTFIDQVFDEKSNLRLLLNRAAYDEVQLESILSKMLGEELLIDSNQNDCPRVFCVSSDLSKVPVQQLIWRNYNFAPDVTPAYSGTSSVKTRVAVRATSAAPTFFTPVMWNNITVIDGAFTANNPSFTAVNEAMVSVVVVVVDDQDDDDDDDDDVQ